MVNMSYKVKYISIIIFGWLLTVAIVFVCFYIFDEHFRGCVDDDLAIPCGTFKNYFKKRLLHQGEKLFITIEIKKSQEKQLLLEENQKAVTIRVSVPHLTVEERRNYVMKKLLLNKSYCGQQHWDEYYHLEKETKGYEAHVYEFPWLVSLVNSEYRCNGFLISRQFFITTEECFRRGYQDAIKPKVLVGVHDIKKRRNCIALYYDKDCNINSKQLHILQGFKIYSIVLVKVDKGVYFNYFVRPICLPLENHDRPQIGNVVYISGWGKLLENKDYVSIKKRNRQKITSFNDDICKIEDLYYKNWMCTLPLQNSTTICLGDEGSPTMYLHEENWIVAGIAIAGAAPCKINRPVFSVAMTVEIVNQILDVIYNDYYMSQQSTIRLINR